MPAEQARACLVGDVRAEGEQAGRSAGLGGVELLPADQCAVVDNFAGVEGSNCGVEMHVQVIPS